MKTTILKLAIIVFFSVAVYPLLGQEKIGEQWYDNGLELAIASDEIKTKGIFSICIKDTATGYCVENLTTGVEVEVYNKGNKIVWKGIASGRTTTLRLPRKMPDAHYLIIKAFRPYVVNKLTATHIHQEQKLQLKYNIK